MPNQVNIGKTKLIFPNALVKSSTLGFKTYDLTNAYPVSSGGQLDSSTWYRVGTTLPSDNINDNIYRNGNVGIGTTTPNYKLAIDGLTTNQRTIGIGNVPVVYLPIQGIGIGQLDGSIAFGNGLRNILNTTGNQGRFNTSVGINSSLALTTGSFNTSIGKDALLNLTTGGSNTAVGVGTLENISTASNNSAFGLYALRANTTGANNSAFGINSLLSNTNGSANTAVGINALRLNVSGGGNIAIGSQAMNSSRLGSNNVVVGSSAGFDIGALQTATNIVAGITYQIETIGTTDFTLIGASSNTIGIIFTATGAGTGTGTVYPNTNTNNNTIIGNNTGRGIVTGQNNTILGSSITGLPSTLTGNVIISDGIGNQRIRIDAQGNTGIGTITPTSSLHTQGSIASSVLVVTTTITLNNTHNTLIIQNGATAITIRLPDALTCIGREYVMSRYAGSTGTITVVGGAGNQIQALNGTVGATTSIALHGATGQGLNVRFTAVNIAGVGVWVRL